MSASITFVFLHTCCKAPICWRFKFLYVSALRFSVLRSPLEFCLQKITFWLKTSGSAATKTARNCLNISFKTPGFVSYRRLDNVACTLSDNVCHLIDQLKQEAKGGVLVVLNSGLTLADCWWYHETYPWFTETYSTNILSWQLGRGFKKYILSAYFPFISD